MKQELKLNNEISNTENSLFLFYSHFFVFSFNFRFVYFNTYLNKIAEVDLSIKK